MGILKKCKRSFDNILVTFLTLLTLGVICGILLTAILVLVKLPLTEFDTSILTLLIVAFCISVVALYYGLITQYCNWKYAKLVMGIIFAILDIFLFVCGITIFALKTKIIDDIGKLWLASSPQSAIAIYFENYYGCCGFDENTNSHCNITNQTDSANSNFDETQQISKGFCKESIASSVNLLGIIIIVLFALLLIVVIFTLISTYRLGQRPQDPELTDYQGQLDANSPVVWY